MRQFTITALLALCLTAGASAAMWDWTGPDGAVDDPTTGNWFAGAGAHWLQASDPASAADTVVSFRSGLAAYTATNDFGTSPSFTLNQLQYAAGDGTASVTVAGHQLSFAGDDPAIVYNGTGLFTVTAPITATTLTLHRQAVANNNNFVINPGNGNIVVDELIIAGGETAGGRVSIQGTQNGIGQVTVGANAHFRPVATLSTTAVLHFADATSLASRTANQAFTVGGLQSDTEGAGRIAQDGTAGGGVFTVNVAAGQEYTFSGTLGVGLGFTDANGPGRTRLVKTGAGTQIISGSMLGGTQTDQITVNNGLLHFTVASIVGGASNPSAVNNNGTLQIDGVVNSGTGAFNVNSGGTLTGAGTINRPVNVATGGMLSGSLTIGSEAVARILTLADGFIYNWNVADVTDVFGSVVLTADTGATVVNVVGDAEEGDVLFTSTAGIFDADGVTPLAQGPLNWQIQGSDLVAAVQGTNIVLIPEPATMGLLLLGGLGILMRRRR